jgi:hypothetical protein
MVLDEEQIKREARPANSEDRLSGKIEVQEEDESRIELLQWYLKMILDSEEGPKIKK